MDIIDQIKETAATANACFEAGVKAADTTMADRLIAAGSRAAESERKLRTLIVVVEETLSQMPDELSGAVASRLIDGLIEARR